MSKADPPGPSDRRLWGLGAGILVSSFMLSGLSSAIPQIRLLALEPEQKAFWLAVSLLAGTACGLLGTLLGGAIWERRLSSRWVLPAMAAAALAFWGLFRIRDPLAFVACCGAVGGLGNLLVSRFDHLSTQEAGAARRLFNDRLGTAFRLLGLLLAPWFFTHELGNPLALTVALALGAAFLAIAAMATSTVASRGTAHQAQQKARRLTLADVLLIGHAVTVYASLYLFAANLPYFFHDRLGLAQAIPITGTLTVITYVAALGVVAIAPWLGRHSVDGNPPAVLALLPGLPLWAALYSNERHIIPSYAAMVGVATTLGVAYGGFLLVLRNYISRSVSQGKAAMLTIYNNLANLSALLAFVGLVILARWAPGSTPFYYQAWLRLLGGTVALGWPLFYFGTKLLSMNALPSEDRTHDLAHL